MIENSDIKKRAITASKNVWLPFSVSWIVA